MRYRDLGLTLGRLPTGPHNAITDVAGVQVGHTTLVSGDGPLRVGEGPVRTGVTAIRAGSAFAQTVPAAIQILNGAGEITGRSPVDEYGTLETPIVLTNTLSVGVTHRAVVDWVARREALSDDFVIPVVAETCDAFLNDIVGGGTGMSLFQFKGGIGRLPLGGRVEVAGPVLGRRQVTDRALGTVEHRHPVHREGEDVGGLEPPVRVALEPLDDRPTVLGLDRQLHRALGGVPDAFAVDAVHDGPIGRDVQGHDQRLQHRGLPAPVLPDQQRQARVERQVQVVEPAPVREREPFDAHAPSPLFIPSPAARAVHPVTRRAGLQERPEPHRARTTSLLCGGRYASLPRCATHREESNMWVFVWLVSSFAEAACPWTEIQSVGADRGSVTVNGQRFPVRGSSARAAFGSTLTECGATPVTLDAYDDWRRLRRTTNVTAAVGIVVWPLWTVTPFTAAAAGARRRDLERNLAGDWCGV